MPEYHSPLPGYRVSVLRNRGQCSAVWIIHHDCVAVHRGERARRNRFTCSGEYLPRTSPCTVRSLPLATPTASTPTTGSARSCYESTPQRQLATTSCSRTGSTSVPRPNTQNVLARADTILPLVLRHVPRQRREPLRLASQGPATHQLNGARSLPHTAAAQDRPQHAGLTRNM
jgi:hypothetical protein